jgi:hypothetical protein
LNPIYGNKNLPLKQILVSFFVRWRSPMAQ